MTIPHDERLVSDPTPLTTQQILREYAALKELIFTRLDAMDKAMELFNANITGVPTDTDRQIQHLKELHEETFKLMDEKFASVTSHFDQNDKALTAALNAAKELVAQQNTSNTTAIAKAEAAFTEQIKQQQLLASADKKAIDEKIDLLRESQRENNGVNKGVTQTQQTQRLDNSFLLSLFVAGLGLAAFVFSFLR